jgi:hypothetical protein
MSFRYFNSNRDRKEIAARSGAPNGDVDADDGGFVLRIRGQIKAVCRHR